MAKYGMPYQGSKSGIADSIITFLPRGKRLADLFGGGGAITECAIRSGKYESVLYNELNPLVVDLFKRSIRGDFSFDKFKPEWVSRERFFAEKEKDGYIKFVWSFSNGGRNYLFGRDLEPKKKSLHNFVVFGIKDDFIRQRFNDIDIYVKGDDIRKRRVLLGRYLKMKSQNRPLREYEELERLQNLKNLERLERLERLGRLGRLERLERLGRLELRCGSYEEYEYTDGDVVYCDPPYEGTAQYGSKFDHKRFYDWVATRDYQVFFSSYQITDKRFKMVWAKGKTNLMAGAKSRKRNFECIYTNQ